MEQPEEQSAFRLPFFWACGYFMQDVEPTPEKGYNRNYRLQDGGVDGCTRAVP